MKEYTPFQEILKTRHIKFGILFSMIYNFPIITYFYKIKLYYWRIIIQQVTCAIGLEWGSSKCVVEANHMHGSHWKEMTKLFPSLFTNIFSVHKVDFHSLPSTFTHRLIKGSSMSRDSHLLLTNVHFHSRSHSSDLLNNSSQSYAQTFIFLWVPVILNVNNPGEKGGE